MLTRAIALTAVFILTASAQSAASVPSQQATLEVLLNEVRALRQTLERINQLGPKIQIALARMQFQEERVRTLTRQVDTAHSEASNMQTRRAELADRLKLFESQPAPADPNARKQQEYELATMKADLERAGAVEQQFRMRESELNVLLQNEQSKWNEVNDQLQSLERALSAAPAVPPRP